MNFKPFDIRIEPSEYDVSSFVPDKKDPSPSSIPQMEFLLDCEHPIFPGIPDILAVEGGALVHRPPSVNINLPHKVIIEVESKNLELFSWRQVQIPVAIGVTFGKSMKETGILMSFLDKSNRYPLKVVPVDIDAWVYAWPLDSPDSNASDSPYQEPITGENEYGQADYWNMTYFTDLPKCSMSYDFWVTVRGVESERRLFETEFHVNGQKITQSNFAAMAEKYPALQE